jgi:hypothetical protein
MAKMKKRRLSWKPSGSPQVIGYKLYWSEGSEVTYKSQSAQLGNVTSIVLPDDVATFEPGSGPLEIGLTAVDELGNESDMIAVSAPYQFSVPEAPDGLKIESVSESGPPSLPLSENTGATTKPAMPAQGSDSGHGTVKNVFTSDPSRRQFKTI